MADTISIRILEDGELMIKTDLISPANHKAADALLDEAITLMGGEVIVIPHKPGQSHQAHTTHVTQR